MTASMGTGEEAWVPIPSSSGRGGEGAQQQRNANCGNDILRGRQLGQHATLFQSELRSLGRSVDLPERKRQLHRRYRLPRIDFVVVAATAPEIGRSMGLQIRIWQLPGAGIFLTVAPNLKAEGQWMQSLLPQVTPAIPYSNKVLERTSFDPDRTPDGRRCFKLTKLKAMQRDPAICEGGQRTRKTLSGKRSGSCGVQLLAAVEVGLLLTIFGRNLARSSSRSSSLLPRCSLVRQPRSTQLPNLRTMRCHVREGGSAPASKVIR